MSTYLLWRRGTPNPLALITHDMQVRRAYLAPQEVIEYLLDHPSQSALRDCYVTPQVIEYPTPWSPLDVFLDLRKPSKKANEVDVRLLDRVKKKPPQRRPRLARVAHRGRASRGFQGSEITS